MIRVFKFIGLAASLLLVGCMPATNPLVYVYTNYEFAVFCGIGSVLLWTLTVILKTITRKFWMKVPPHAAYGSENAKDLVTDYLTYRARVARGALFYTLTLPLIFLFAFSMGSRSREDLAYDAALRACFHVPTFDASIVHADPLQKLRFDTCVAEGMAKVLKSPLMKSTSSAWPFGRLWPLNTSFGSNLFLMEEISLLWSIGVVIDYFLMLFRVRQGLFGFNKQEAEELIAFAESRGAGGAGRRLYAPMGSRQRPLDPPGELVTSRFAKNV